VNITRVNTQSHKDGTATLSFGVEVRDAIEYNRMSERIHALPDIVSVDRPTSGMGREQ
jgi:(p)ppGpp synthase/HD superfamily hydrolase